MHEPDFVRSTAYKRYLLFLLTVILAFNFLDRVALGLLLQDIKMDLKLSDTQLGLLSGIAFALFYSVMGIPIARWADRGNRAFIISITTAIWSVLVALCGAARTFSQLLLIRIGVGVGEAGCVPPAHSLIADHFDRDERPRAIAIYQLGLPLSFVIGYFSAGWLNQHYGWRTTFVLLGTPGLVLALLASLTLRDTHRARKLPVPGAIERVDSPSNSWRVVAAVLWENRTYRQILLCVSVIYFAGYGILQWQPTFFMRTYGLTGGELGRWFALSYGFGGLLGTYAGGEWAYRFAARNEARQLKVIAQSIACTALLCVGIYLSPSPYTAFLLMALNSAVLNILSGPLFATVQTVVPAESRAVAVAVIYFLSNLIGMGLGPLAVGMLSDALRPLASGDSLRWALLVITPPVYLWGAWHAWKASSVVKADLGERALLNEADGGAPLTHP